MSFGLCNALCMFMRLMNEVLNLFLKDFCVVYLDDMLMFNKDLELHLEHLTLFFEKLWEQKQYINIAKCEFVMTKVHFLGLLVSEDGFMTNPMKVEAIKS